MLFDHVGVSVSDFARSKSFYLAALAPLGVKIIMDGDGWAQIGKPGAGMFWFGQAGNPVTKVHLAFSAATEEEVRSFHSAGLAAGGRDNGVPGPRPQYGPDYYAAFVLDPDNNNIEAVCRRPA